MIELLGIWISAFLTLCIFSFLFKDNPFYRFAEHVFIGVSAGFYHHYGDSIFHPPPLYICSDLAGGGHYCQYLDSWSNAALRLDLKHDHLNSNDADHGHWYCRLDSFHLRI